MDCSIQHCVNEATWRNDVGLCLCGKHYRAERATVLQWSTFFNMAPQHC